LFRWSSGIWKALRTESVSLNSISADEIVDLIDRMVRAHPEVELINFVDGDFLFDGEKRGLEFADKIIAWKKNNPEYKDLGFHIQTTVFSVTERLLERLKEAGLQIVAFGQEVASERVLLEMGKLKPHESYQTFIDVPLMALDVGVPIVRTTWILYYPSIFQTELLDSAERIIKHISLGIRPTVSAYIVPRSGARIMEETGPVGSGSTYEAEYKTIVLPDGSSHEIPTYIRPNDPVVAEIAKLSVAEVDQRIKELLASYGWSIDANIPEQLEALVLLQLTLENIKRHPGRSPEISDQRIGNLLSEINILFDLFLLRQP
jgi:hypothetical protein